MNDTRVPVLLTVATVLVGAALVTVATSGLAGAAGTAAGSGVSGTAGATSTPVAAGADGSGIHASAVGAGPHPESLQSGNETVVKRGENATIVRRSVFSIVEETDRAYSSIRGEPVVANDQVYAVFNGEKLVGDEGKQRSVSALYALDAATLDPQWRAEFELGTLHGRPVVANGSVYVVIFEGGNGTHAAQYSLYAFDTATGERRWQHELGSIVYDQRGAAWGTHGRHHPLYVIDGRVHTLTVDAGPQSLVALDPATGDVDWRHGGITAGVGTDGERIYAGYREDPDETDSGGVVALDPASGEPVWTRPNGNLTGHQRVSLVTNDRVYAARTAPLNSDAVATLHALDPTTGEQVWSEIASGNSRIAALAVYPDSETVVAQAWSPYDEADEPKIQGIDDTDGKTRWVVSTNRLGPRWDTHTGEENLYVYYDTGYAAYSGDTLHGPNTDGWFPQPSWGQSYDEFASIREIVEVDGTLYEFRRKTTDVAVSAFDATEGDKLYEFQVLANDPAITVTADTIYLASAGVLSAYEAVEPSSAPESASPGEDATPSDTRPSGAAQSDDGDEPSTGPLSAVLAGTGPLGAPLSVLVGIVLGMVTGGVVASRRYER